MPKVGWKTTEFWATVLVIVGSTVTAISGNLPDKYSALASAIATAAYAISRGLAKLHIQPTTTTESTKAT
jgi:hypothetical protein